MLKQENLKVAEKTNNLIALQRLTDITDIIQKEINRSFEYAEFLDLMVQSDPENVIENFNKYGMSILERNHIISNVQLAPDAIVEYIYPIEGNEAAIGHNLLTDPERGMFVKKAIEQKTSISQGPVDSIQGTLLVFNRKPVFIKGKFWGLSIVTVNFEQLLEECGLSKDSSFFSYAIQADQTDGTTDFVWGNSKILELNSIKKRIELPGQVWQIAIYPDEGWGNTGKALRVYDYFAIISICVISFLSYFHIYNYMLKSENAKMDPLTHTLNISAFQKFSKNKIKQKHRKHALIIMDLNEFKQINDNYGHPIGDAVIIEVSNRLSKIIRNNDRLSRMGGDEFLIFLCDVENEAQVKRIALRIVESILEPMSFDNIVIHVAISVGFALYPEDGVRYELLYQTADERMYICKQRNKDNMPCFVNKSDE